MSGVWAMEAFFQVSAQFMQIRQLGGTCCIVPLQQAISHKVCRIYLLLSADRIISVTEKILPDPKSMCVACRTAPGGGRWARSIAYATCSSFPTSASRSMQQALRQRIQSILKNSPGRRRGPGDTRAHQLLQVYLIERIICRS